MVMYVFHVSQRWVQIVYYWCTIGARALVDVVWVPVSVFCVRVYAYVEVER